MIFSKSTRLFLAAASLCAAASASTVFNFDSDALGTSTKFTDTVNGISATFSSSADPGGFIVYASMFETLTGNVLGDPGPAGANNLDLSISFNKNLGAVSLDFATADFGLPSPLVITAYENSKLVGSSSATGSFLSGFTFPEGEIAFAGVFNQLVISSTAPDFAIDNINVAPAPAPEPALAGLFGLGLLALGIPAVRRKSRRAAVTK
ncbi:MAG: hypothetical protein WB992_20635 [Bryobacteraceae bacterium]